MPFVAERAEISAGFLAGAVHTLAGTEEAHGRTVIRLRRRRDRDLDCGLGIVGQIHAPGLRDVAGLEGLAGCREHRHTMVLPRPARGGHRSSGGWSLEG